MKVILSFESCIWDGTTDAVPASFRAPEPVAAATAPAKRPKRSEPTLLGAEGLATAGMLNRARSDCV